MLAHGPTERRMISISIVFSIPLKWMREIVESKVLMEYKNKNGP